ncbi:MAG: hypothetical protein K1X36_09270 [Pyrinomonadaceae bacterium]|nr:hypothetical protein [Pyrinomonadaceae bacterium]
MSSGSPLVRRRSASTTEYTPDAVRKQFTGYERDSETDLDFANTRGFSYRIGRFLSADNVLNDSNRIEPASWNLYVYCRNNPLVGRTVSDMRKCDLG